MVGTKIPTKSTKKRYRWVSVSNSSYQYRFKCEQYPAILYKHDNFFWGGEEQQFSCVLTDGEKKLQIRLSWQNCFYQISSHQHKERSDLEIGSTEKKNFTFRSGPPSTTSPMLATASRPYQEILSSVLCY